MFRRQSLFCRRVRRRHLGEKFTAGDAEARRGTGGGMGH